MRFLVQGLKPKSPRAQEPKSPCISSEFRVQSPESNQVRSESEEVVSHRGAEQKTPPSAFRLPPSAFRLPPSAIRLPHFAFTHSRAAFTLVELMIALAIGLGVVAASFSAYIFVTRSGKSLEAQIDFSEMYRSLYANYTDIIEDSRSVSADDDDFGITITYLKEDNNGEAIETNVWFGYIEGDDAASSKLVFRPGGKNSTAGESVFCSYVSPVYDVNGDDVPMFTICGYSAILNVHIGDRMGAADTTGPGYQGIIASIAASSRNLKRKL